MDDDRIVSLEDFRISRTTRYCGHKTKCVDPAAREVFCAACNAKLDPFDSLLELSRNHVNLKAERELVKNEIERLRKQRDDLRKEVANVKAQRRRSQIKEV